MDRQPPELQRVWLVRHGEVRNPEGLTYGRLPGFGLSARGHEQAQIAAAGLAKRLDGHEVRLVSSPLERAHQTAAHFADALGAALITDERLIEAGSMREGLPRRVAPAAYLARLLEPGAWQKREPAARVAARMRASIEEHIRTEPRSELVIVSHQLPIWLARAAFEHDVGSSRAGLRARLAPLTLLRGRVGYCSLCLLELTPAGLVRARELVQAEV